MKSKWSDCKNWRIHRKISTPKYNNWTFCSNFILKVHNNFPTSFQYFVFCSELLKLTSKSPQAHTVSIYFSQPVIESSWESHCKLSTFLQQVIDICRERHYNLSVFISCSKLLKVNNNVTRRHSGKLRQVYQYLILQQGYWRSTKGSSIYFWQKSY